MNQLQTIECKSCNGTGIQPLHKQSDNHCVWCGGKGKHLNVPYPMFCLHPEKCAGKSCCPRDYCCCD